ncbi:MAG: phage minor head protein, partial [Rhodocyclaceae bacterium]|nr:phage minor head protein [Rhodocyclaceae bacterium]
MPVRISADPGDAPLARPAQPGELARALRLDPEEAARYMAARDAVRITYDWHELWQDEHARAFTVSRLTRADLLQGLYDGLVRSVGGDLTRRDWMRDARKLLADAGWWGEKTVIGPDGEARVTRFDPRRLKLIYDVNTRMAHAAGRWERIQAAKDSHPYLRYVTRADERVRQSHRPWHNVTLPVDDPWWRTHYPPCGWRCRCRAIPMRAAEYGRRLEAGQIKPEAPQEPLVEWTNPRTGEVRLIPWAIDPGFAYNVGEASLRWRGLIEAVGGRLATLPSPMGAALWASLDEVTRQRVDARFAAFVDEALAGPPRGRMALAGALPPGWIAALRAQGVQPASAEIMVRDADLWHMQRDSKARKLPMEWLRQLPAHLRRP